jgi:DNA repair exonuclease SbcCD ATPase subunit
MHKDPREYFIEKLEEDTKEIEEQLDELETKLEDAGWEPELDYENQIENLRIRLKKFKEEVDRFEASGESTWGVFKKYYGKTLSRISKDAQDLTNQLSDILPE